MRISDWSSDVCSSDLVVGVVLFVARRDGAVVLDLAEEALDAVAVAVEEGAEGGSGPALGHRLDVGPGAALREGGPEGVAVIGAIGEQDLAAAEGVEHVGRALAVMGLAFAQLQGDRQAIGVDESVDLRSEANTSELQS